MPVGLGILLEKCVYYVLENDGVPDAPRKGLNKSMLSAAGVSGLP